MPLFAISLHLSLSLRLSPLEVLSVHLFISHPLLAKPSDFFLFAYFYYYFLLDPLKYPVKSTLFREKKITLFIYFLLRVNTNRPSTYRRAPSSEIEDQIFRPSLET